MNAFAARLDAWSLRAAAVTGVSATRTLLGFVGLMYYIGQYQERNYLFGPEGLLTHDEFKEQLSGFSLYALSASPLWFQLVFHAGAAVALAVTLGVGGRPGLALHWVFLWSIYQRQPGLLDGGDNLAYVVLPMLLLTRCYDRFAFPTGLAHRIAKRTPSMVRSLSVPVHNLGILAIATQMCPQAGLRRGREGVAVDDTGSELAGSLRTWTGCGRWRPSSPSSSTRPDTGSPAWRRRSGSAPTPPGASRRWWSGSSSTASAPSGGPSSCTLATAAWPPAGPGPPPAPRPSRPCRTPRRGPARSAAPTPPLGSWTSDRPGLVGADWVRHTSYRSYASDRTCLEERVGRGGVTVQVGAGIELLRRTQRYHSP